MYYCGHVLGSQLTEMQNNYKYFRLGHPGLYQVSKRGE